MSAAAAQRRTDLAIVEEQLARIAADPEDRWIGRVLGERYRIVRHLADGGMGKVFEGEQISLGMTVAIKVLDSSALADPMLAGRF